MIDVNAKAQESLDIYICFMLRKGRDWDFMKIWQVMCLVLFP